MAPNEFVQFKDNYFDVIKNTFKFNMFNWNFINKTLLDSTVFAVKF